MKSIFVSLIILGCVVLFISCSDTTPTEPDPQPPEIISFTATPDKIILGNQATLSWVATNADSVIVNPGGTLFLDSDTGQTDVSPVSNTFYTLIVFNKDGADTSSLEVQVSSSFLLSSLNGDLFKAEMGGNQINPEVTFKLTDSAGSNVVGEYISLEILEGDGTLASDSILTNSEGEATVDYSFDGLLGHAEIKAKFSGFDSVQVEIRADMLRPGQLGQAQYILMTDNYSDIIRYNGAADSIDVFLVIDGISNDTSYFIVAVYEATHGFVAFFESSEPALFDTSSVYGISVVDSIFIQPDLTTSHRYEGTTVEGIGIGSIYSDDIFPVYGVYTDSTLDNSDPELSTNIFEYTLLDNSRLVFWCKASSGEVYQIDFFKE